MFLEFLLFNETPMEAECTTDPTAKYLKFPPVKRAEYEDWNKAAGWKSSRSKAGAQHSKQTKEPERIQRRKKKEKAFWCQIQTTML